jgi:phosphate transport system substrate-binding protein
MRRRLAALAAIAALWSLLSPAAAEPVRGAGSTFAYPAIARWSQGFQAALKGEDFVSTESGVDYEPVGSLAGTMRLAQPEVDFAATDVPLPADDLKRFDLVQFPLVMGGVAVAANLPGIGRDGLRLDARTLAGIFSGRITAWNDPAVAAVNPGAMLPALPIRVVTRSDGSGTTLNFTRYLAQRDAEWKRTIGSDTLVKFPVGESREGTGRVLRHVQDTPGAIAYVEYGQARRTNLAIAAIENGAGRFVAPSAASG